MARVTTQKLVSDPDGATSVTTAYDNMGRVLNSSHPFRSTNDPTYGLETPTYDALSRVTAITHPDGSASSTSYGPTIGSAGITAQLCSTSTYGIGYPVLSVDEAGKKSEVWTDGFGRLIETDEPDTTGKLTSATCNSYDLLNNLLQVTQGAQTRSYAYDVLSRVTSATAPETGTTGSHTTNYFYTTASGGLCSGSPSAACRITDTRGITKTFSYDALNRLTGVSYSDTTPAVSYTYDQGTNAQGQTQKGFRTGMSDSAGTVTWTYDLAGRVLTQSRTLGGLLTKTISYAYNLDGSISTLTYPSGRQVVYTVGNAGRLTAAKDAGTGTQYAGFASYAPTGAVQMLITGQIAGDFGGITESHTYNKRLEYTGTEATSSNGTPLNLTFAYSLPTGNNGSVSGITNNVDTGRTENIQYDPLNRITSAATQATTGIDCWGQSFVPDALANLNSIGVTQCSAGSLSLSVDGNNHVTNAGFAYDLAGNMTQDGSGFTYTFDAENHIAVASGMTGGPFCYGYDGDGLRVAKAHANGGSCSSTNTQLQVDALYWRSLSGDTLAETDDSGNTISEYVFFAGRRVARLDASANVFYYFADPLGNTRTITDSTGHACYDADFTPYGQELIHTNTCPQNYKFTGFERDPETGNDYAFARYYSPRLARFLSPDPLSGSLGDPQTLNRYAYTRNDPVNNSDPSGAACYGFTYAVHACDAFSLGAFQNALGALLGLAGDGAYGCQADGVDTPCSVVQGLLESGAAVGCPDNQCTRIGTDGRLQYFFVSTNGPGSYYNYSGPGALYYSADQAGIAAVSFYGPISAQSGPDGLRHEYGGTVYADANDVFSYSQLVIGPGCAEGQTCTTGPIPDSVPEGAVEVGTWHTHPWEGNSGNFGGPLSGSEIYLGDILIQPTVWVGDRVGGSYPQYISQPVGGSLGIFFIPAGTNVGVCQLSGPSLSGVSACQ